MTRVMASGPTKVIQNRLSNWKIYTVHLLPILCTALLLGINFAHLYWFPIRGIGSADDGGVKVSANNIVNSLQLVAKLYEILVIASIGTMALETFRLHLVGDGIPFALISGAYRIFDVTYLFNPRFWRAAPRAILLAALLLLSILLCALIGPASAILIVPKPGWFPLPNAFSKVYMPLLISPYDPVWPNILNGSLWEDAYATACREEYGIYTYLCPASGMADIFTWASGMKYSGLRNNLTFQDPSGRISRQLDMWSNASKGTFLSTPTLLTVTTLGQLENQFKFYDIGDISHTENYRLRLSSSSVNYQPLVDVKCNVWNLEDYNITSQAPNMSFPYKELSCFSDDPADYCIRIREVLSGQSLRKEILDNSIQDALFEVTYGKEGTRNENISSLVFYARLPYLYRGEVGIRIAACSYMAHWIPTRIFFDPTASAQVRSNITDLSIFVDDEKRQETHHGATAIRIDRTWLPYLDLGDIGNESPNNNSQGSLNINRTRNFENILGLMDALSDTLSFDNGSEFQFFGPGSTNETVSRREGDYEVQKVLEMFTGTIVTDAIARTAAFADSFLLKPSDTDDAGIVVSNLKNRTGMGRWEAQLFANGTSRNTFDQWNQTYETPQELVETWKRELFTMYLEAERFGYGFGTSGGAMVFAVLVILIYLAVVLVYWSVTLYRRTETVAALGDVQDLIALAWRSATPSDLGTQGINFRDESLWQEYVAVRATSSRYVTMVMDMDEEEMQSTRLRKGVEYF